jgi:hypothetical protein
MPDAPEVDPKDEVWNPPEIEKLAQEQYEHRLTGEDGAAVPAVDYKPCKGDRLAPEEARRLVDS